MKTVLIILCTFLLKTETEAQTWQKISPEGLTNLRFVKIINDDKEKIHLFTVGEQESKLYYLKDGRNWLVSGPIYAGVCHTYSDKYGSQQFPADYRFEDIIQLDERHIMLQAEMQCSGSADYMFDGQSDAYTKYNRRWKIKLDTFNFFKAYRPHMDTIASGNTFYNYSLRNQSFYGTSRYQDPFGDVFDSLVIYNSETFTRKSYLSPVMGGITLFDPRQDSTIYIFPINAYTYDYTELGVGLKSTDNGRKWDTVIFADFPSAGNLYSPITFLKNNLTSVFLPLHQGLYRYEENSDKAYNVLNKKVKVLFDLENSDIAYAGTESGEIYRSTDAGETWSLFASGFSTKPVIGIYASGNDSLIVGTEDGIWANYQLPVSVTEEIPFKNNELTITPNPANSSLKISILKTDVPQQLSVFNSLGQLVFKTEFSGEFMWDFKNDIPDGVYTVALKSGNEVITKQFLIIR